MKSSQQQWTKEQLCTSNEEARLVFRYHFSLKLMENLPTKCLCGHKVGDGTHLLVCKKVNAGHADRSPIGAELDSYGVIVRYEQRATYQCEGR